MILFYDKRTGDIFSQIQGRHHPKEVLETMITLSTIPTEYVGKYIIPFTPILVEVDEPIVEQRVTDFKTGKVEKVVIGTKKIMKPNGYEPDVPFKDIVYDLEDGKEHYNALRILETDGKILITRK